MKELKLHLVIEVKPDPLFVLRTDLGNHPKQRQDQLNQIMGWWETVGLKERFGPLAVIPEESIIEAVGAKAHPTFQFGSLQELQNLVEGMGEEENGGTD
jgi:hypothetical protein